MKRKNSNTIDSFRRGWNDIVLDSEGDTLNIGRSMDYRILKEIVEDIASKLRLNKEHTLLEAGCGSGILLSEIDKKIRKSVGFDFSAESIKIANSNFPHISFNESELTTSEFGPDSFDRILCYSVFHYLPDIKYAKKSIENFLRICKPNGFILIGDIPSKDHFHLSPYYKKKTPVFLYKKLKSYIKLILKGNKKLPSHSTNSVTNYKEWLWYDIEDLKSFVNNLEHHATIYPVPKLVQWHEKNYRCRFDLLIQKKL